MLSWRLAFLSIKKKKESSIVLTVFLLLSVLFLNLGISINEQANEVYFRQCELSLSPHLIVPCSYNNYKTEYEDYIQNYPGVKSFTKEEVICMPNSKNNRNGLKLGAFFHCLDSSKSSSLDLTEEDPSVPSDSAIYVPLQLKKEHVALGDSYVLTYKGSPYSFTVAGFFESTYYCNTSSGFYQYYVNSDTYQRLANDIGRCYLLGARFSGTESEVNAQSAALQSAFRQNTSYSSSQETLFMKPLDYDTMRNNSITNILLGVVLLCAVAILICIVVLITIMNTIRENLTEDMTRIGVLESMGYTSRQIILSYCFQYLPLGCVGSVLGTLCSYLSIPILRNLLSGICGFLWKPAFHPVVDLICILLILAALLITSLLTVRKVQNLSLVDAVSKRTSSHIHHRNILPLQKGPGSIHLRLAFKQIFLHGKTNLVYAFIVAIGTFAIGTSLILLLNFSASRSKLITITGLELSDLQITLNKGTDPDAFANELLQYEEVRKVNTCNINTLLKYNNNPIKTIVCDHYEKMEVIHPYTGSFPEHDNEIVISYLLSKNSGKGVGDSLTLSCQGFQQDFFISGIYSSSNGEMILMNLAGMQSLVPDYPMDVVDVYLKPGFSIPVFQEKLQTIYKVSSDNHSISTAERKIARLLEDYNVTSASFSIWQNGKEIYSGDSVAYKINQIEDMKSYARGQMESYAGILSSLVIVIFLTTLVIIASILRITIKSSIQKSRTEYGIFKSMGYTALDLIKQLSLSFLITSLFGSVTGGLLAVVCSQPIFQNLFTMMGVAQIEITPYRLVIFGCSLLLSFILYFTSMLCCWQIRKITPYELLNE